MGADSKIGWTDQTWNPWIGCQEVSPACDNCYAREQNNLRKWTEGWGPHGQRRRTSDHNWKEPLAWDRKAQRLGIRLKVFCGSLCDVFDNRVPAHWHSDVWMQIRCTPHLDWLMLTKRPQNIASQLPDDWGTGYPNVRLGTTTEDQERYDQRRLHLLSIPAAGYFFSVEPMLGPVIRDRANERGKDIWYICGGESGTKRRELNLEWAESLRDSCARDGVPFFFKQDSHRHPGKRGRASDALWATKQFPVSA